MKQTTMLLVLTMVLVLADGALAMSSTNYHLDWFVPLSGGGSGSASSTNYAFDFTVGQSAIGMASSTNYGVCLGFWGGVAAGFWLYLPLVLRSP